MSGGPLNGEISLATGSGAGNGRAIALKLAQMGSKVVVNDIDEEIGLPEAKANKLVKTIGATGDKTLAEDLERSLTMLGSKRLVDPYRKGRNYDGSFNIGKTESGKRINLERNELNKNLLVVGETGSGKTNLFYHLTGQLMDQDLPVLALDFKQDYRHLDQLRDDVLVLRWEDFKFNPIRPPKGSRRQGGSRFLPIPSATPRVS